MDISTLLWKIQEIEGRSGRPKQDLEQKGFVPKVTVRTPMGWMLSGHMERSQGAYIPGYSRPSLSLA